jgi:hypothetical protein
MDKGCKKAVRKIGRTRKRKGGSGVSDTAKIEKPDRELDELQAMLLGAAALSHAKVNSAFRQSLREALLATVTDPADMALLPDFFLPSYRSIQ